MNEKDSARGKPVQIRAVQPSAFIRVLYPSAAVIVAIGVWALFVHGFKVPDYILPPPEAVFITLVEKIHLLMRHSWATVKATIGGLALSIMIGVPFAMMLVWSQTLERAIYRRSDAVTALSDDLAANVSAKVAALPPDRRPVVRVIPNFVDTAAVRPMNRQTAYRGEHGLGDRTVVMYAGNLGHSQSLDLLVEAARRHLHRPDLAYVVNGGGVRADALRRAAEGLPNLTVVGYQPAERVPEVLATADVHVVPLRAGLGASSVPSKTYAALAAGRPVVASVDEGTEVARVVSEAGAGLAVPPDDLDALVAAVEHLADDPGLRTTMGAAGRRWAERWRSPASVAEAYAELVKGLQNRS